MGFWGLCLSVVLGFTLLPCWENAQAKETAKIYSNGQWEQAESLETARPAASVFGDWFSEKSTDPVEMARQFLLSNAGLLQLDGATTLVPAENQKGETLETQRLHKFWNGIPVLGGDSVVALSRGQVLFANADSTPLFHLNSIPRISGEEARSLAFASYRGNAEAASDPALKVLILGNGVERGAKLVFEVTVRDRNQLSSDIHFIDADTAEEVMVSTNVHTLVNRKILAGQGSEDDFGLDEDQWKVVYADKGCSGNYRYSAEAYSRRWDPGNSGSSGGSGQLKACSSVDTAIVSSADSAWKNSGLVYDYYLGVHKRNSIDGRGMLMKSVVNFGGSGFPNAAWYNDKSIMLYGVGDGEKLNDFAGPLDVAAHEITHGITARTSALEYVSEPGALNESYSDVFGKLVAFQTNPGDDWKMGKDLFKEAGKFVRDMENPDIGHTKDFRYKGAICSRLNDFCGVHSNSGIPNRAAVLLSKKIGNEKLGKIYFLTLTQLLRKNSDFKEAKAQSEAACNTLFGKGSADCRAVREAFAEVGI